MFSGSARQTIEAPSYSLPSDIVKECSVATLELVWTFPSLSVTTMLRVEGGLASAIQVMIVSLFSSTSSSTGKLPAIFTVNAGSEMVISGYLLHSNTNDILPLPNFDQKIELRHFRQKYRGLK